MSDQNEKIESKAIENHHHESPEHLSSKENSQNSNVKTLKKTVSSRLYKSTAASAAKAAKPPLLPQAGRNRTPVQQRKNPSSDYKTPMHRPGNSTTMRTTEVKSKLGQKNSKTIGIATSSFISQDKVVSPVDWDASAICPPTVCSLADNGEPKMKQQFHTERKIGNPRFKGHSVDPGNSLRTLRPDHTSKLLHRSLDTLKSEDRSKDFHKVSCDSIAEEGDDSDDIEVLYDEYLMSELIRIKAEKNYKECSKKIDSELTILWSAVEELRSDVLREEEKNRKMRALIDLARTLEAEIKIFEPFITDDNLSYQRFRNLSDSLEQCRHYLQVLKSDVNSQTVDELATVMENGLPVDPPNSGMMDEACALQELEKNLAAIVEGFKHCQLSAKNVKDLQVERDSLILSKEHLNESKPRQSHLDLLKLPPRPRKD